MVVTLVLVAALLGAEPAVPAGAATSAWPTCTTEAQTECVESLSYTSAAGTVTVADPGRATSSGSAPYIVVSGANPGDPMSMVSFTVNNPGTRSIAPNVDTGLEDGTYSFTLRLGAYDPTQVFFRGDPLSITTGQRTDGSFYLSISAKPVPYVRPGPTTTYESCKASGWTCDGESATLFSMSGGIFQNLIPANRPLFRGMWLASNGVSVGFRSTDLLLRKISANAAGPHTVPAGFPTTGLTMENGKALSPAFFKTFVPYTTLQAMLSLAPEEIRQMLTPETVKARITEAGTQTDQPVKLTMGETGVTIDLGITHFSEPNPEITFSSPVSSQGQTTSTTPALSSQPKYSRGKRYLPSSLVKVPAGYRVSRTVVSAASRSVCAVSGTRVVMKKTGTCAVSVTAVKGKSRKVITDRIKVT
jgi:hypothetical protein